MVRRIATWDSLGRRIDPPERGPRAFDYVPNLRPCLNADLAQAHMERVASRRASDHRANRVNRTRKREAVFRASNQKVLQGYRPEVQNVGELSGGIERVDPRRIHCG